MNQCLLGSRDGGGPAIIVDGKSALSYRELDEKVNNVRKKLTKSELFFLIGVNDVPTLICYLASLRCGAIPLLLETGLNTEHF